MHIDLPHSDIFITFHFMNVLYLAILLFFFSLYCGNVQAYIIEEGITYPLSSFNCFSHLASSVSSPTTSLPSVLLCSPKYFIYLFVCLFYFFFFFSPKYFKANPVCLYYFTHFHMCLSQRLFL